MTMTTLPAFLPSLLPSVPPAADADLDADLDLAALALAFGRDQDLWRPGLRFCAQERVHARLYADERLEAWLQTWLPGQGTELHDHGGSSGAVTVLGGWLREVVPAAAHPLHRGAPGRGPVGEWLAPGSVRTFGPEHVHQIVNISDLPAVSLHVYAPRLTTITRYAIVGGALEATAIDRAGVDW